ncbi:MAG: AsmA-like C-terminal region-containing protein [Pseudomonadota bacterium]
MRWLKAVCGVLLLAVVAAVIYLFTADLGRFRESLTGLLSDAVGRPVRIDGDLSLRLGRTIRFRAQGLTVGNAPWADDPLLLSAGTLAGDVAMASVFRGPLRLERLALDDAVVRLQKGQDGRWNLPGAGAASGPGKPPEFGALSARRVTIHVLRPELVRPGRIEINSSDLARGDAGRTLKLDAVLNNFPLALHGVIGPGTVAPGPFARSLRFDARLGEMSLELQAEVEDLRNLKLAEANVSLQGPDAGYLFSVLNLPRVTSGPMTLRARLDPQAEAAGFSASGQLGEYQLSAEGRLANLRGPDGFDFSYRASGPDLSALGRAFSLPGLPARSFAIGGQARSHRGGVAAENTLMTIGEETIRAEGELVPRADGGQEARLAWEHAAAGGWVTARSATALAARDAQLSFEISGPNAQEAGRFLKLRRLPPASFHIKGEGTLNGAALALTRTEITADGQRVAATGTLSDSPQGPELDLRLTAKDVDLTPWAGELKSGGLPPLTGSGRLTYAAAQVRFAELELQTQGMTAAGELAFAKGAPARFDVTLTGEDAAAAAAAYDLPGLPALPFDLQAAGAWERGGITLDSGQLRLQEQLVRTAGRLSFGEPPMAVDLQLAVEQLDPLTWPGVQLRAAPWLRKLDGTGRLQVAAGWLRAGSLALSTEGVTVNGNVAVNLEQGGRAGNYKLDLTAESAATLAPWLQRYAFSGERVQLSGSGSWDETGWEISPAAFTLADRGRVTGRLALAPGARPKVTADLTADRLDLRRPQAASVEPPRAAEGNRLIPATALNLEWMKRLDAEFALRVDSLVSSLTEDSQVQLDGSLRDGHLAVTRLSSRGRRGELTITLDATPQATDYRFVATLDGVDVRLGPLDEAPAPRPVYALSAQLEGEGNNLQAVADSLVGELVAEASPGTVRRRPSMVSRFIFEDLLRRTLASLIPVAKNTDTIDLECLHLTMNFQAGVAKGNPILALQTSEVELVARGEVDLGTEAIDLDIVAQPRKGLGLSLADLINPFTRLGGTLAAPRLVADPKTGAIETGVGIATGGLWPLGRKLLQRFAAEAPCASAMKPE